MSSYLRSSSEFQKVYRTGIRFDEAAMTAFVLPNELTHHRLGVTASRKAIGNAVKRNRAKRMLREAFRLSDHSLRGLVKHYDWVLNGKSRLLSVNTAVALGQFENILARVAHQEVARQENASSGLQMA